MKLRKAYAIMDVKDYAKYLHEKYKDKIEQYLESRDFYMDDKAREKLLSELLVKVWRSVSLCLEHKVEVRFNKGTNHHVGTLLTIHYAERHKE